MVGVQPGFVGLGEQAHIDAIEVDGGKRQGLELEVAPVGALDLGFSDRHQVLDADAEGAGFVEAGLVADDHAGLQRHVAGHLGDALRTLVDRKIGADAMAGAVIVV